MEEEPGLDTGDHATAEERYAAAAAQLKGRDKLDREQLRELRQQMRAEKKVRWNPEPVLRNTPKLRIRQMQTLKESLDGADISCSLMWWCVKTGKEASELHSPSVILREPLHLHCYCDATMGRGHTSVLHLEKPQKHPS